MSTPPLPSGLKRVLTAQTQVAFNDNAAKLALIGLAHLTLPKEQSGPAIAVLSALLVLPFILFSPICGWAADRFPKKYVLEAALAFQLAIMGLILFALAIQSLPIALGSFFLLALQSTLFSPAKQGILKEIVGSEGLGRAVGWAEMLSISAILGGSFAGGWMFDQLTRRHQSDPWLGATWTMAILFGACILAQILIRSAPARPAASRIPFTWSLMTAHVRDLVFLWENKGLRLAALGVSYFFGVGGVFYLIIVQVGSDTFAGGIGSATQTGWLLTLMGVGIAIGALLAARASRHGIELGLIPIGGLGLSASFFFISLWDCQSAVYAAGLVAAGIFSGCFIVPLNAFLQDRAPEDGRGRVLGATNLMTNLAGIAAVALFLLMSQVLGLSTPVQFIIMGAFTLAVALYIVWLLPESLLRFVSGLPARLVYRVTTRNPERIPAGGALLVCNHVSYVDAIILQLACPRPVLFLAFEEFFRYPVLGTILRIFRTIPISSRRSKEALQTAAAHLREGELVCIFPEGELTRTGKIMGFKRGFELIARQAACPVVPVHLDSLWGSIFSFSGGRYFRKWPLRLPYHATVSFGTPLPHDQATAPIVRQAILDLSEASFRSRPELESTLSAAAIENLKQSVFRPVLLDLTTTPRSFNRGQILGLSLALASLWKQTIPARRIGIALPPGIGGTLANVSAVLAGKIPVNLNLTAGTEAGRSCIARAGIDTIITSPLVQKRFPDYPWTEKSVDISAAIAGLGKTRLLLWLAAAFTLPACLLKKISAVELKGGDREAVLLFTSGSSGLPKGVVLTHRNILGNVAQVSGTNLLVQETRILGCLPLFHSFGLTVTLWFPVLRGCSVVTIPSPLDGRKVGEACQAGRVNILVSTPTFLRGYARKVDPAEFATVRYVISGAEKLPADLAPLYKEKYGIDILEGYGLTETSPVTNVNVPNPCLGLGASSPQIGWRPGSVGRLLPGLTARIIDHASGETLLPTATGVLHLKGANVFAGYLDDPERTQSVLRDGWFNTGDLGRFDEDGFLFIEGRLSRFSKIGGEMVPHGTVESKISELLALDASTGPAAVVMGVPDPSKGEALVLITTAEIDAALLRKKLAEAGLPNLWCPKQIVRVEQIPVLGSGKLDLAGCRKLAENSPECSSE